MSIHTDEMRTRPLEALITPSELAHAFPITDTIAQNLLDARREVEAILTGADQRLLVIVGPCSIHDPIAARDYAERLNGLRKQYQTSLCIVMRTYFEKPRTT
ncbi:MAG: 3-deoxy-7-phosphoheptulonate synthase, partial [Aeromonas sp.]